MTQGAGAIVEMWYLDAITNQEKVFQIKHLGYEEPCQPGWTAFHLQLKL